MEQITEFLKWLKGQAERHPEVCRVYLFGSFARGDATGISDIDVAFSILDMTKWSLLVHELREHAPILRTLDLVCLEKISEPFRKKILKEGKLIYERPKSKAKS